MSLLEEKKKKWHQLASSLSFYNAAEGDSWQREANKRKECKKELIKLSKEFDEKTLNTLKSEESYLIYWDSLL